MNAQEILSRLRELVAEDIKAAEEAQSQAWEAWKLAAKAQRSAEEVTNRLKNLNQALEYFTEKLER